MIIEHAGESTYQKVEPGQLTVVDKVLYRGSGLIKPICNCRYGFPYYSKVCLTFIYNKPWKDPWIPYYDLWVQNGYSIPTQILKVEKLDNDTYKVTNVYEIQEWIEIAYSDIFNDKIPPMTDWIQLRYNESCILPANTTIARVINWDTSKTNYCKLTSINGTRVYHFKNEILIAKNGSCVITDRIHWLYNPLESFMQSPSDLQSVIRWLKGFDNLIGRRVKRKTGYKYKLWIKCRQPYRTSRRNWYTKFRWFCVEKYRKYDWFNADLEYQLENLGVWREPENGHRIYIPGKVKYQRDSLEIPAKKLVRPMYIDFMLAVDVKGNPVEDQETIKFRIRKCKSGRTPIENGLFVIDRI